VEPHGKYRYSEAWRHALMRLIHVGSGSYYQEMNAIGTHAALRRLWIAEGKRRGYELVNA